MNSESLSPKFCAKFQSADETFQSAGGAPSPQQAAADLRAAAGERAQQLLRNAEEQAHILKERALEKAQQFRNIASEKAHQLRESANVKVAHAREVATEQWNEAREKARDAHQTAEDYVRQHPTRSVLGALGIGFLIGLLVRR